MNEVSIILKKTPQFVEESVKRINLNLIFPRNSKKKMPPRIVQVLKVSKKKHLTQFLLYKSDRIKIDGWFLYLYQQEISYYQ